MASELEVKVYYEDTDCLGVVYHANYLKYFERGRTEMVSERGKPLAQWNAEGFNIVVFKMEIVFHKPAKFGDRLRVVSEEMLPRKSRFRMRLDQKLYREDDLLTEAVVHLVCLDEKLELREMPDFPPEPPR